MPEATEVREMFARVADRYDRANHLLSLGIDHLWRRAVVRISGLQTGERVLDVCAGTGDLSETLARAGGEVIGSDFCPEMLVHAARKYGPKSPAESGPRFLAADTMQLPFEDDSFDLATVAFGIRNVADPVAGLREMARVLRPGGRVVVLEFSKPRLPGVSHAYMLYFKRVLPRLGRWITGDQGGAYDYLPASVMAFPERGDFLELMAEAGLENRVCRPQTMGIASLYRGDKPLLTR